LLVAFEIFMALLGTYLTCVYLARRQNRGDIAETPRLPERVLRRPWRDIEREPPTSISGQTTTTQEAKMLRIKVLSLLLIASSLLGCSAQPSETAGAAAETAGAAAEGAELPPVEAASATLPPGHPPLTESSRQSGLLSIPGSAPEASAGTAQLTWQLPESWVPEPPASSMRLAQASIPGPGGPATMVVFFFGVGGGGGVQANLDRWEGQMEASGLAERSQQTVDGLTVHRLLVRGTLLPSTMGAGPATPEPDSVLIAAVVEGAGGPWFIKVTGPAATLDTQMEAWEAVLESLRLSP
jgi:hypothetical protein